MVPREYVFPQRGIVRDSPNTQVGVSYTTGVYSKWTLPAGDQDNMGLIIKAAPYTIYKKAAIGAWADNNELFGNPLRVGKTDVRDEETRDNMFDMLAQMTSSAYAVVDKDDEIVFVESSKSNSHSVFDANIERMNSEMSKIILGSTMTVDDGSSRSQSEVHEKTSDSINKSDSLFIEYWVNNCLLPFLNENHGFGLEGMTFMFDNTENVSVKEQFERDIQLLEHYNIPAEYILDKYGTPVEQKEMGLYPINASAGGANEGK